MRERTYVQYLTNVRTYARIITLVCVFNKLGFGSVHNFHSLTPRGYERSVKLMSARGRAAVIRRGSADGRLLHCINVMLYRTTPPDLA